MTGRESCTSGEASNDVWVADVSELTADMSCDTDFHECEFWTTIYVAASLAHCRGVSSARFGSDCVVWWRRGRSDEHRSGSCFF